MLFLFTMLIFCLAFVAIAIGLMFGRSSLQGSCGGLAMDNTHGESCSICGRSSGPCEQD